MSEAHPSAVHRLEFDLREYWSIIWRWKWVTVGIFLVVFLSVLFYVRGQAPLYESSVSIRLSSREPLARLEGGRISWYGPSRKLDTQIKLIVENDELHRRARALLLSRLPEGSRERALVEADPAFYLGKVAAEQLERSDVIRLTVTCREPALAQQATQCLAEAYVQWFIDKATQEVKNTRDFVRDRLQEQQQALEAVEEEVSAFEQAHPGVGTASVYRTRLANLEVALAEALERYTERHPQVVKLREEMAKIRRALEALPEVELRYQRLLDKRDRLRSLVAALNEEFLQRDIAYKSKVEESIQEVAIIRAASRATPRGADPRLTTVLGALIGLIVGLGAALVAHALDSSLATVEGVEELTGLPVLGEVPYLKAPGAGGGLKRLFRPRVGGNGSRLIINFPLQSRAADAYKTIREKLLDQLPERPDGSGHIVLVTSAAPKEGKTLTALNLALVMAQSGRRVLYLEADLRRPVAAHLLGLAPRERAWRRWLSRAPGSSRRAAEAGSTAPSRNHLRGLSDILVGSAGLSECTVGLSDLLLGDLDWERLVTIPGIDNIKFVFSGTRVHNPAEVLATEETARLFDQLRRDYEFVVADCAPAFPVPDPGLIGPLTDGACLVYNIGITSRQILLRATQLLSGSARERGAAGSAPGHPSVQRRRTRLLGVVLNQIRPDVQLRHYYQYRYRYYGGY